MTSHVYRNNIELYINSLFHLVPIDNHANNNLLQVLFRQCVWFCLVSNLINRKSKPIGSTFLTKTFYPGPTPWWRFPDFCPCLALCVVLWRPWQHASKISTGSVRIMTDTCSGLHPQPTRTTQSNVPRNRSEAINRAFVQALQMR